MTSLLGLQANGLDERYNQTLQNMLVKYVHNKKDAWDEFLDTCVYAYNTSVHESTCFTPFELMFGRKARLPIDIEMDDCDLEECINEGGDDDKGAELVQHLTEERISRLQVALDNIKHAQKKQKQTYDRKHACPSAYDVGATVLMKDTRRKKRAGGKMDMRFDGPYIIAKCLNKGIYCLQHLNDSSKVIPRVSANNLKPYCIPRTDDDHEKVYIVCFIMHDY